VLSGFITPPATDSYTFYIASANASELWLSSDSNPDHAVKIAEEPGTNTKRNWPGYGTRSHISAPIPLTQGRWYFVRAIHKAGLGTPHLAVAWQRPGEDAPATGSAPISGEYLSWILPSTTTQAGGSMRIARSPTGQLLLTVENVFKTPFSLETSGDLVHWQAISTNTSINGSDLFSLDLSSKVQPKRFYRVSER